MTRPDFLDFNASVHDVAEAMSARAGVCPCQGEADDPGPHIAACPLSDPAFEDEGPDVGSRPPRRDRGVPMILRTLAWTITHPAQAARAAIDGIAAAAETERQRRERARRTLEWLVREMRRTEDGGAAGWRGDRRVN